MTKMLKEWPPGSGGLPNRIVFRSPGRSSGATNKYADEISGK